MSETDAVKINDGIYWVGFADRKAGFSNNPYLIIEGDSVVLIDPGSRLPEHFEIVKRKIEQIVPIEKIDTIIVHHQDPDLCASIPLFEEIIGINNFELIATMRSSLFLPYYGVRTEVTTIDDGEILELDNGRQLLFLTSPYLHFAVAHVTIDLKTHTLFSSDIFAAFSVDWSLFANENYVEAMRIFHEPYIASKDAVQHFADKIINLDFDIKMIAPQHGSVILEKDIPKCLQALLEFEVGQWIL